MTRCSVGRPTSSRAVCVSISSAAQSSIAAASASSGVRNAYTRPLSSQTTWSRVRPERRAASSTVSWRRARADASGEPDRRGLERLEKLEHGLLSGSCLCGTHSQLHIGGIRRAWRGRIAGRQRLSGFVSVTRRSTIGFERLLGPRIRRLPGDLQDDLHPLRDCPRRRRPGGSKRTPPGRRDDEELAPCSPGGVAVGLRHRDGADGIRRRRRDDVVGHDSRGPPVPSPFGSPPWMTNLGTTRWIVSPSKKPFREADEGAGRVRRGHGRQPERERAAGSSSRG